uniref:B-cell scaffold protein with ankyrin repeats n=1 Tax=Sphaeramia orbicularis TaxID=375764 RepID=A0A672ZLS2_9TELE
MNGKATPRASFSYILTKTDMVSLTAQDLLIIYEPEAEQWATYLHSVFTGVISDQGICCYDISSLSSRKDDFLRLAGYTCKLLILSKGMLEGLCQMRRFFLARVLSPAAHVVVLLCGVDNLTHFLELVPLNGNECLQISSEQDAHEYLSTVTDIVRKGMALTPERKQDLIYLFIYTENLISELISRHFPCISTSVQRFIALSLLQSSTEVFILLRNEAAGVNTEVEFTGGIQVIRVKPTHWGNRILCVDAPDFPAGSVKVTVFSDGVPLSKAQLSYYSNMEELTCILSRVADPVDFMCQVSSAEKLDQKLSSMLLKGMPTGGFQGLQTELHHADVPTLLHFAARYGLKSVSSLLLQCPGAERAVHTANRHGQTPIEISKSHGHTELHILLRETLVFTFSICSFCFECLHYLSGFHLSPVSEHKSSTLAIHTLMTSNPNLIDPLHARTSFYLINLEDTSIIMFFPILISLGPKNIIIKKTVLASGKADDEEEEEDPYAPLGVNDEYDTILTSTTAIAIANRPPAPTPRPETTPVKEDRTPYIAQVFKKKKTQQSDADLYSLPTKQAQGRKDSMSSTYDTYVPNQIQGLQQLVELRQRVKAGSLTVEEALERLNDWQRVQKGMNAVQQARLSHRDHTRH